MTNPSQPTTATSASGSIYDLGYRRYEGPRLGRGYAVRTLLTNSFRTTFGIGRGGRAKIAPMVFGAFAVLPAVIIVGIVAIAGQLGVDTDSDILAGLGYERYWPGILGAIVLFCAAQAPELFGRDQRYGTLSLYFARALRREDYVLARAIGFALGLLVVLLLPMLVLFIGRLLVAKDIVAAIQRDAGDLVPILAQAVLIAGLLGSLAMAVAAYTPRRAYATAGILALFTIPSVVAQLVTELGRGDALNWVALLSPTTVLDATNGILFGIDTDPTELGLPDVAWFAAALVGTLAAVLLTVRRYRQATA